MTDVVMVLGMHRSGTSSVAGVLTKLGCTSPKHIMPANSRNARGYFESTAFMIFHDELLHSAGSQWNDWRPFNPTWFSSPAVASFRQRAIELFNEEFDNQPLPILKDPRICRFLPFWLGVLNDIAVTPHVVIPIRPPLDVAHSLRAVHELPLSHGLLLWLRHVLDAEYSSRAVERSIFTWKDFRSDWRKVSDQIASETSLSWPRLSDRVAREIDVFLASELVHYEMQNDTTEWMSRTYSALLELARNPFSNSAQAELDDIRRSLDQASGVFGRLLIDNEINLEEARSERDRLCNAREVQANELDEQRRQLEIRTGRNADLETALLEATREKEGVAETLSAIAADRDALTHRCISLEMALGEATRHRDELSQALRAASEERDRALSLYEGVKTEIDTLAGILKQDQWEKGRLSSSLEQTSQELERVQFQSSQTLAALEATQVEELAKAHLSYADALAKVEQSHDDSLMRIRVELVNAEAAFHCARIEAERSIVERLVPITLRRRKLAKMVLSSGLFDAEYYCSHYPDTVTHVAERPVEKALAAALHYIECGFCSGFRPNAVFDSTWYLERYEDVRRAGLNPLLHYFRYGWREGRDPGPDFNTIHYLRDNPDVKTSGTNPMIHYIRFGHREGRQPVPKI